ncbi:MAG: hypothetical protein J3K34DRAFT_279167 [Monoraphidium minutum]|nr:MAG: hypothetical protein J3K34DRAFT_279167 [Monoraphidium minutum]
MGYFTHHVSCQTASQAAASNSRASVWRISGGEAASGRRAPGLAGRRRRSRCDALAVAAAAALWAGECASAMRLQPRKTHGPRRVSLCAARVARNQAILYVLWHLGGRGLGAFQIIRRALRPAASSHPPAGRKTGQTWRVRRAWKKHNIGAAAAAPAAARGRRNGWRVSTARQWRRGASGRRAPGLAGRRRSRCDALAVAAASALYMGECASAMRLRPRKTHGPRRVSLCAARVARNQAILYVFWHLGGRGLGAFQIIRRALRPAASSQPPAGRKTGHGAGAGHGKKHNIGAAAAAPAAARGRRNGWRVSTACQWREARSVRAPRAGACGAAAAQPVRCTRSGGGGRAMYGRVCVRHAAPATQEPWMGHAVCLCVTRVARNQAILYVLWHLGGMGLGAFQIIRRALRPAASSQPPAGRKAAQTWCGRRADRRRGRGRPRAAPAAPA